MQQGYFDCKEQTRPMETVQAYVIRLDCKEQVEITIDS